jgi:NAD(P)H-hydrate repair Nnr-like enzyme with NAD(P)H-hydrate dehydratase domain
MNSTDYWRRQEPNQPLFPDVLWSKPERRDTAGKLAIVGGNAHGFAAVAAAYQTALAAGVGQAQVILPDVLKSKLPAGMTDAIFAATNPSGGLAAAALSELNAAASWANLVLFIGDNGQNSETAGLLETFLAKNPETPVVLTRDAVDLIKNAAEAVLNRAPTNLVVSFSQLQKLFRAVYYPRVLTFSQGVKQVAETLHKFTITYPCAITLWHAGHLFAARAGQVVTQKFDQPMRVWSGEIAAREAVWQIWQRDPVQAVATSWVNL